MGAHVGVFTHHSFENGGGIVLILNCFSLDAVEGAVNVCLFSVRGLGENLPCAWALFLGNRGNVDFSCLGVSVTFDRPN